MAAPSQKNALTLLALPSPGALDAPASPLERARACGARYLLEGTLRRAGGRLSTQFTLSEAPTGALVWSGEWPPGGSAAPAPIAPVRVLVEEVASAVLGHENRRIASLPTESLTSEELWLRGSAIYDAKPTLKGIDEAMVLADRALRLNPHSVSALNLKAFLLLNRYDEEVAPDHDRYARDLDALTAQMLSIDPRDLYSWDLRVHALMHAQRWASAAEAAETMFRLEGPIAFSVVEKAGFLVQLGRPAEALELLADNAPTGSKALPTWGMLVTCHARLLMGQHGLAASACE
jgi:tetratricopeptide (TPR) repeat protein